MQILMITPLDYHRAINNREHNMARHFLQMGCHITMIYKALNRSPKIHDMVLDTCSCWVTATEQGGIRFLRVDPFFNYYAGLRASSDAEFCGNKRTFSLRRAIVKILSPAAFLRDLFVVPCMLYAGLVKTREHYQVCIGFGPWGALAGWLLKKMRKIDVLVYEDRDFEPGLVPDSLRRSYTAWVERKILKNADLVVSLSYRLAKLRESQTGNKINIIPTGVEWEKFQVARESYKNGRKLIYVGNVISWSGLDCAIKAMPRILQAFPDAKLLIVGDGLRSFIDYLKEIVVNLGLVDRVEFLGRRSYKELPQIMGEAMVGLANGQPVDYRKFAYPLKVIEYMAAGLPVVGTEGTETADIIARCDCGISIPYKAEALADAVIRLFNDENVYSKYRANGIRESAEMGWGKLMRKELDLIEKFYADFSC